MKSIIFPIWNDNINCHLNTNSPLQSKFSFSVASGIWTKWGLITNDSRCITWNLESCEFDNIALCSLTRNSLITHRKPCLPYKENFGEAQRVQKKKKMRTTMLHWVEIYIRRGRDSWNRIRLVMTHALVSHRTCLSLFKRWTNKADHD